MDLVGLVGIGIMSGVDAYVTSRYADVGDADNHVVGVFD